MIYVEKTKAQIRSAGTAQLICVFIFAYGKVRYSRDKISKKLKPNDKSQDAEHDRCTELSTLIWKCRKLYSCACTVLCDGS